jgi:hypothetical protein
MTKTQLIIEYLRTNPTAASRAVAETLGVEYNQSFKSLMTRAKQLMADPLAARAKEHENNAKRSPGYWRNSSAKLRAKNPDGTQAYRRAYQVKRRNNDPAFKLADNMRTRIYQSLRAQLAGKRVSAVADLGCTMAEFVAHLEARFHPGMTWKNYGTLWHIDHIRPLASFDLTDPAQQAAAAHFSNQQPLWAFDNLSKGSRWLAC